MKFYSEQTLKKLHPQLTKLLAELRARRHFEVEPYLAAKTTVLNTYMKACGLKSCVVAVSGGIDSAVVLALVQAAAKQPGSPIEKIIPIALPVYKEEYTKNQESAMAKASELFERLGLSGHIIDLTQSFSDIKEVIDNEMGVKGDEWASGQLVAYTRTPAIYYVTSLMTQLGKPAIICGTTNRDEGSYLGYVGKASDGMVDVQIISDLHKSEVRAIGRHFHLPASILDAEPTGDMFDGRTDEEVFGVSYDFVELFLLLRALENELDRQQYLKTLSEKAKEQYEVLSLRLEKLHRYNAHKYLGKSPAVHLDVLESGVPGGWESGYHTVSTEPKGKEFFVNPFTLSDRIWPTFFTKEPNIHCKKLPLPKGLGVELSGVLSAQECQTLLVEVNRHGWQAVGIDGIVKHYKPGDPIGSWRASSFSPELAQLLWKRMSTVLWPVRVMDDTTPIDWDHHPVWRMIGVSPLFRFIKYTDGGLLVPHFDAPFTYPNGDKTLMSVVLYLEANNLTGGQTRFIIDPALDISVDEKDFSDWSRVARDDEVLCSINPAPGGMILFDHRILHDSQPLTGQGEKIIIRTDMVFTKCGPVP